MDRVNEGYGRPPQSYCMQRAHDWHERAGDSRLIQRTRTRVDEDAPSSADEVHYQLQHEVARSWETAVDCAFGDDIDWIS